MIAVEPKPTKEVCAEFRFHAAKVEPLRQQVQQVAGMAQLFKALADDTRLQLVYALSQEELCGCDLSVLLGISQAAVSHHLRTLRQLRLVTSRREGKVVYYTLADAHVEAIIAQGLAHWKE